MGSLINTEFWRKRLSELANQGKQKENLGNMCKSCAFRLDSEANLEPQTIEAAILLK